MTLRARITLLVAGAVALAVAGVAVSSFVLTRRELRAEVDTFLLDRAASIEQEVRRPGRGPLPRGFGSRRGPFVSPDAIVQVVGPDGSIEIAFEDVSIPVDAADLAVGRTGKRLFHDVSVDGEEFRVLTVPSRGDQIVQVARSLEETNAVLDGLQLRMAAIGVAGVLAAAAVGWAVARRSLVPIDELTAAAEHIATTQELAAPIEVEGRDEVGRLATSFNTMLRALDESRRQQHQLVQDASHELRTPLTSLRTNIEVLARRSDLDDGEREELLADVTSELEELTALVGELVDLATDVHQDPQPFGVIRLDEIVATAVARAERRTGRSYEVKADASMVEGNAALLERAISNLLDNADKWSPPDQRVAVEVHAGKVEVRDRGSGIAPEDRPLVFERFYRADGARAMPGSGLGLAIVHQIIMGHGGRVWADAAAEGGAAVGFELPLVTG